MPQTANRLAGRPISPRPNSASLREAQHRLAVVGSLLGLWLVPLQAHAFTPESTDTEPKEVRVRLLFRADPTCTDAARFQREIERRAPRIRFVDSDPARTVDVTFRRTSERSVIAILSFELAEGKRTARELRATSCDEAVEALALVTALTLDPSGVTLQGDELAVSRDSDFNQPASRDTPAEPASQSKISAGSDSSTELNDTQGRDSTHDSVIRWWIGADVSSAWGVAPSLIPGAGVFVSVASQAAGFGSPAARLSLSHARRGGFESRDGTAFFALSSASLELCPVGLVSAHFALRGCGVASGGALHAEGSETDAAQSHVRPWLALGGSLAATVPLQEWMELSINGELVRPLMRDRFQFDPNVFHRVSPIVASARLGIAVRFP